MLSLKLKKSSNWKADSLATPEYIRDYIGINRGNNDIFTQAAKDYAVNFCVNNIESLKYGLENKLISGKPYKMSDLYEQASYTENAFMAGIRWALQYVKTIKERKHS